MTKAGRWPNTMMTASHRTALITGASSGIGAAYARTLANLGFDLILVARRTELLERLALDLRARCGIAVEVLPADLSTAEGIAEVESRILARDDVDFLVNCAGYSTNGPFAHVPVEETIGLINCHAIASVRLARAALPGMLAREGAAIVNVASIGAFLLGDVSYSSTKAFLVVFSQCLDKELTGTSVRVQALCPGFTRTEFHDRPSFEARRYRERIPGWLWMSADDVVAASLRGLSGRRVICIPGLKYRLFVIASRAGLVDRALGLARALVSLTKPAA